MLTTVKYDDEPPVTYKSNRDRVLFETLKYASGLTVREIHHVLGRMLVEGGDPEWIELWQTPELRDAFRRSLNRLRRSGEVMENGDG